MLVAITAVAKMRRLTRGNVVTPCAHLRLFLGHPAVVKNDRTRQGHVLSGSVISPATPQVSPDLCRSDRRRSGTYRTNRRSPAYWLAHTDCRRWSLDWAGCRGC